MMRDKEAAHNGSVEETPQCLSRELTNPRFFNCWHHKRKKLNFVFDVKKRKKRKKMSFWFSLFHM